MIRPPEGQQRPLVPAPDLDADLAAAIVALAPDGILVMDESGSVRFANRQAETIFGYHDGGLAAVMVEDLVPDRLAEVHREHRARFGEAPRSRPMGAGVELWGRCRDGGEVPVEISLSPITVGGSLHTVVIVREVTEQRARESSRRLRMLVADQERIGADLNDGVIQRLFRAGMGIQSVLKQADGHVAERLGDVVRELDQAIVDIRNSVFDHELGPQPE